jgi:hypothetical protein
MACGTLASTNSYPSKCNPTKVEAPETEVFEMNILHVDESNPNRTHQNIFMDNVLKTVMSHPAPHRFSDPLSVPQFIETYHNSNERNTATQTTSLSTATENCYTNVKNRR